MSYIYVCVCVCVGVCVYIYESESESESLSVMSSSLRPHGLHSPWNSPGQNTGVSNLCLPQVIFPTEGSNPGLPHCRWILYQLSHREALIYVYAFFSDFLSIKVVIEYSVEFPVLYSMSLLLAYVMYHMCMLILIS